MPRLFDFFKRKTGALISPPDPRDIPVSALPVGVSATPSTNATDISHLTIYDQKNIASCTGHAHAQIVKTFEKKETGIVTNPSPRFYYAIAKKWDGIPNAEGTYPKVVTDISRTIGGATEDKVPNITNLEKADYLNVSLTQELRIDARPRRIGGYAYVDPMNREEIKRAIIDYGLLEITIGYGKDRNGRFYPGTKEYHRVVAYGYEVKGEDLKIHVINSWGTGWGKNGLGYFMLNEYYAVPGSLQEFMVYTDIPNEVLEEYKALWPYKYFKPNEVVGLKTELIEKLDSARGLAGIPFRITSGLRTPEENRRAGGVDGSAHILAKAVDIHCGDSVSRLKMVKALLQVGFTRLGVGSDFIHADIGTATDNLAQNVMWTYYK